MNEEFNLEKFVTETCNIILKLPIEAQNEAFGSIRRVLVNERRNYLEREYTAIKEHQERTDFAGKSLETVFIAPFGNDLIKQSAGTR